MVFGARGYAVLLVSASEKFNSTLRGLLPAGEFWPLDCASGAAQARRKLLETSYDLVIINAPLPDDFGVRLALELCAETDYAMKSSSADDTELLCDLLIKLAAGA